MYRNLWSVQAVVSRIDEKFDFWTGVDPKVIPALILKVLSPPDLTTSCRTKLRRLGDGQIKAK